MQPQYHVDMTTTMLGLHFEPEALQQVIEANLAQDSLISLLGGEAHRHFCDREIERSFEYIDSEHARIAEYTGRPGGATVQRAALGRLLHTAQDFYAHTNYVELWLSGNGGLHGTSPVEIDALDREVIEHPELRVAEWVPWREWLYYVPMLGSIARRVWLPTCSHEAMHLDGPERGPQFAYALETGRQRTEIEYRRAVATIYACGGEEAVAAFHGK
jgi:hypothetical protein